MARWKVTAKHYMHAVQWGQKSEWERTEMNMDTGRQFRKTYPVPMLIDPEDKWCINQHEGFCVVAREGTEKPGDIIIFGPPTPDMEPLDAAAQAETDAEKPKWIHPIDGLEPMIGQDFGEQLLQMFERQLDNAGKPQSVSLKGASSSEMEELKAMVLAQQQQIAQLLNKDAAPIDPIPPDPDPDAIPTPPPIRVDRPRPTARRM